MVLASDLASANGRFLLPRGTVLDAKQMRILKIWGIDEADVEGVSREETLAQPPAGLDPELLAQSRDFVEVLFRFAPATHEAMQELKRLCVRKSTERLAAGKPLPTLCPLPRPEIAGAAGHPEELPPTSPRAMARREVQLASFPDIYFQIMDVLNNPRSSVAHTADVVGKDPSLAVKLLRVVNSPFYGFPSRVDSISRAVTLVGANELSLLALGVSVVQYFEDIPPEIMDMKRFWKHSIATGVYARILAGHKPGFSEERFFLGGLIHDIGRLAILKNFPHTANKALKLACSKPCMLFEAEIETMGFDHAAVAGCLLNEWKFPAGLEQMVRYHHAPEAATNPAEPAILHLADIMARTLSVLTLDIAYVPRLHEEAWNAVGITPGALAAAASQAEHLIHDIFQTFLGAEL